MEDHRAGSFAFFAFEGERKSIRHLSLSHGIKYLANASIYGMKRRNVANDVFKSAAVTRTSL